MDSRTHQWKKSSRSDTACVEVTAVDSGGSSHDKAAEGEQLFLLRDSKNPDGPVLTFTPAEWHAFVAGVKDGEFDI
ncbi:DUF397 domain-containing protein [Spongiactinospora sp. TRM90649]|uniref:DUF397 domain-containing protein n=1 Tax=Spongiactinospora sp. TRM90649 TaxID=3031114 RepID=UPI0023F8CBD1|nr:DUF397 domain-containing protein [Spongiactinospora sp. TRM90649]MDF5753375.1 DUF397 domain-containing protein [Spongiactinospora sp. TRM90649]